MQGLQHVPLHTQSNQRLDKTHDEWCNWRWQQSNATSLSVWGERRVASGWLPYRIYCYCCLIKKYWDCLPTFEHLQQQNEIIHTTGLHLYIIVFVCVCKCIKQIHKAFPPSSSLHLRLTLLFLTLSIKSSSPVKKRLCGMTGVCVCQWVSGKKGGWGEIQLVHSTDQRHGLHKSKAGKGPWQQQAAQCT